jgi:steroid 5-alpha reductase family enzyme
MEAGRMSALLFLIVAAFLVAMIVMTIVWLISVRLNNAGIVDIAWSANFALIALIYALFGPGYRPRRTLAGAMMIGWSLRLAILLWKRVVGHIETEDGRYAKLRASWGPHASRRMLFFFLFQGVTNVVLSLPVLLACLNPERRLHFIELCGAGLWVIALGGESAADAQLRQFKADPANRGHVMKQGLWRYSRHPNYFFEWLVWCAYLLVALGSPYGWTAIYCPLLMLWFLYKVTGIPATEEHAVETKGEEYREYQRTTSPFIPWFPRRATTV